MKNLFSKYFSLNQDSMEIKRELREDYFYVAACAILIEIAKIDGEFSGEEISTILFFLQNEHNLAQDEAEEILSEAEQELKHSIDLWKFTNAINKNYSKEDKLRLLEFIWEIIYSDDKLDKHEDNLVHKLSRLLNIPHSQMIDIKVKVKQQNNKQEG